MRLVLDDLASRLPGERHHVLGNSKTAPVVDADLGDDQRRFGGAYFAMSDLHERVFPYVFQFGLAGSAVTSQAPLAPKPKEGLVLAMTRTPNAQSRAPLRYRAAIAIYQAVLWAAMPLVWRYFRRRAERDPAYGLHLDERRGVFGGNPVDVWIHAVSLGEFRSAEPVIRGLLSAGKSIILTHATPAGRAASEAALATEIGTGRVQVSYAPVDRISAWSRFFRVAQPRAGLIFEMEFWPGMTEAAVSFGVNLWFVNSQIPEKSFPRVLKAARLLGSHPATRAQGVMAKSTRMASRFKALGAANVEVVGETRFDIEPPSLQVAAGQTLKAQIGARPLYVFASVVEGEEHVYMAACQDLGRAKPKPLVIWVPRAPEVFQSTYEMLRNAGLHVGRRSTEITERLELIGSPNDFDILLGDSFGEMFFYLSGADVVSVGGGFVEKGAHNVIEPLALGKPIVTGPHIWTIEFPGREARDAGVLTICKDPDGLADALTLARDNSVDAACDFHRANIGASGRIVKAVIGWMEQVQ